MDEHLAERPLVFVCYANEDRNLCRRLVVMLRIVLRAQGYDAWWDQSMTVGEWNPQLEAALDRAAAGIILVSEDSLTSDFIMERELPRLMETGRVAPVYARPCPWESVPAIATLEFLGSTDMALSQLGEIRDELSAGLCAIAKAAPAFLGLPGRTLARQGVRRSSTDLLAEEIEPLGPPGDLHGVPNLPNRYFERDALAETRRLLLAPGSGAVGLAGSGPLGVHGIGGIGKSVLAAAVARDDDIRRAFPDGVYWVVLGELPDVVAAQVALAAAAGLTESFQDANEGRRLLQGHLQAKRVLVIIDDVWTASEAEAFLVTGPVGRVLLTSRHIFVLDALRCEQMAVGRLDQVDALRFLSSITHDNAPAHPEAIEIVEALGGIILGLALVGATIAHGTTWHSALEQVQAAGAIFTDDSFADQFKAMYVAWMALEDGERERYGELAVFGEDTAIPAITVGRLWRHTAGSNRRAALALLRTLDRRELLSFQTHVQFHDLQRAFLQLQSVDASLGHRQLLAAHRDVPSPVGVWNALPDDEPYLWAHLVEHLIGAGDVEGVESVVADPVWLLRRYELAGLHAVDADLSRAIDALPTVALFQQLRQRVRQIGHILASLSATGDRALSLASRINDLVAIEALSKFFPLLRLVPSGTLGRSPDALERVLTGHSGPVRSVAWSPNGRRLASGGSDGTVRVWNPVDDRHSSNAEVGNHSGWVQSVAWCPYGDILASGGKDGAIRIWSPNERRPALTELGSNDAWVDSIAWSPDGKRLATTGDELRVWEFEVIGSKPRTIGDSYSGVAWSLDGLRLAAGGGSVHVWECDAFTQMPALVSTVGWVWSVAWSPDRGVLAAGTDDGAIFLWNPERPQLTPTPLRGHGGAVQSLAWSPDGTTLASGGDDGTVRLWEIATPGSPTVELRGHEGIVYSVAWSPDGRSLATAGGDGSVRIWVIDNPQRMASPSGDEGPVRSLALSADGRRLATGSDDGTVCIWDLDLPSQPSERLEGPEGVVHAVAWSPTGRTLAAGGRSLWVWHVGTDGWGAMRTAPVNEVSSLGWSPEGGRVVCGGSFLRVLDVMGSQRPEYPGPTRGYLTSVAWAPQEDLLAVGGEDGLVGLVERETFGLLELGYHIGAVRSIAWSPNGRRFASAGTDGAIRIWSYSPEYRRLILVDDRGPGWAWVGDTAEQPGPIVGTHPNSANSVQWSGDGTLLATCGGDGTIRLWDSENRSELAAFGIGVEAHCLSWRKQHIAVGTSSGWILLNLESSEL